MKRKEGEETSRSNNTINPQQQQQQQQSYEQKQQRQPWTPTLSVAARVPDKYPQSSCDRGTRIGFMAGFWIDSCYDGKAIMRSMLEEGRSQDSMFAAGDIVLINVRAGAFSPAVLMNIDGCNFRVSYLTEEGKQSTWQGQPVALSIVTEDAYEHVISKLAESGHRKDRCGSIRDMPPVLRSWLSPDDRDVSLNPTPRMTKDFIYCDGLFWRPRREGAIEEARKIYTSLREPPQPF